MPGNIIYLFLPVLIMIHACATTPNPESIRQAEAHNKLGTSYINNGQLNEANIEFQKALSYNPQNKEVLNNLGLVNSGFGKHAEAINYYKRALAIDPYYSEAANNLGVEYATMRKWDNAIKYFMNALSNPTYSTPEWAYSNMGYAYYMKGDFAMAEQALKEAILRNPVFPRAMFVLGLVYTKINRDDLAIKELKRAIGIKSDYLDAHWEIAKAYMRKGLRAKALKHFKVVAEKEENTVRMRKAIEYINQLKYSH